IKNLDDLSPYNNLLKTLEKSTPSLVVVLENELPYFYISMPLLRSVPGKRSKDFTGIIIAKANIVEFIKPVFLLEQGNILKMELSLLEESGSLPLYDTAKSFGYKFSESQFELTKRTINH